MKKFLQFIQHFVTQYPAILASYFIYGYYFISTMQFYIDFKKRHFGANEILGHFDTLLWMWALAYVLVKVIMLREKLHVREKENLEHQHTIQIRESQLETLHDVIMTLKHEINNPLAIILGYARMLKKETTEKGTIQKIDNIEIGAQRISTALKGLSEAKIYEVTQSAVGNLVSIPPTQSKPE